MKFSFIEDGKLVCIKPSTANLNGEVYLNGVVAMAASDTMASTIVKALNNHCEEREASGS